MGGGKLLVGTKGIGMLSQNDFPFSKAISYASRVGMVHTCMKHGWATLRNYKPKRF